MTDDHDDTQPCPSYKGEPCNTDCICDVRAEVERLRGEVEHWKKIALRNARERSEAHAERDAMREQGHIELGNQE